MLAGRDQLMMASSSNSNLGIVFEDHLSCPICTYAVPLRLPPCQHLICEECIAKLKKCYTGNTATFKCPTCEAESPGNFPPCIVTESIRDSLKNHGKLSHAGKGCMVCEEELCDRQVDLRCRSCRRFICFRESKYKCDDVDDLGTEAMKKITAWQHKVKQQVEELQSKLSYAQQIFDERDRSLVNVILFAEQLDELESGNVTHHASLDKTITEPPDKIEHWKPLRKLSTANTTDVIKPSSGTEINEYLPINMPNVEATSTVRPKKQRKPLAIVNPETHETVNISQLLTESRPRAEESTQINHILLERNRNIYQQLAAQSTELPVTSVQHVTKSGPSSEEIEEKKRQFRSAIAAVATSSESSSTDSDTASASAGPTIVEAISMGWLSQ